MEQVYVLREKRFKVITQELGTYDEAVVASAPAWENLQVSAHSEHWLQYCYSEPIISYNEITVKEMYTQIANTSTINGDNDDDCYSDNVEKAGVRKETSIRQGGLRLQIYNAAYFCEKCIVPSMDWD